MTEKPNLTSEQKEKNQQYILDHLDEYVIDTHKNIVNVAPDTEGEEWFFSFGENSFTPEGYREIQKKMFETILREIKDWELYYYYDNITRAKKLTHFKHRASGRKIYIEGLSFEQSYEIMGELGYRKNIWENYEETIKLWREREKYFRENVNNGGSNNNSAPPETQTQNLPPPSKNNPQIPNQNNHPSNHDKQDQPSNNSTNSPSPTDIQTSYNSDKAKLTIDNNSSLTTPEQKDQAQELLKIIIAAELLIQKNQFNQEILAKLLKGKNEKNNHVYQLLEGRANKVINKLKSIQKSQQNNNSVDKNNQGDKIPTEIIVGGICLAIVVGLGMMMIWARKKKLKNK